MNNNWEQLKPGEKMNNNWEQLKIFINKHPNGSLITCKRILHYLEVESRNIKTTTIDTYRIILTKANILKLVKPGVYRKVENIPEEATLLDIIDFAYNELQWVSWFCPLAEFIERRKNEKNKTNSK